MRVWEGVIREIQLNPGGIGAWIDCPKSAIPTAGQYMKCWLPEEHSAPLAHTIFPMDFGEKGFLTTSPVPSTWHPGKKLMLRGPSGKGFRLPDPCKRLAAVVLDSSVERVYPILKQGLGNGSAVTLCTDQPLPDLPFELEVLTSNHAEDIITWADFVVMDFPSTYIHDVRELLKKHGTRKGQALVHASMPCGGMAECGVCAFSLQRRLHLPCKDGPVYELQELCR